MGMSVRRARVGILAAVACTAIAVVLFARWSPPVQEGFDSLKWPSVPGEIVEAWFWSEYNAEQAHGMDTEMRDEYTKLRVAYWAPGADGAGVPLVTNRFDTATGLFRMPGPLSAPPHETQHVLAAGDALRIRYNPEDPESAVVVAGPPWLSMMLMAVPVMFVGLAIAFVRWGMAREQTSPNAADTRAAALIAWPALFLTGAVILGAFLPPIWVRLFDGVMPWWVLAGVYAYWLVVFVVPSLAKYTPIRELGIALIVAVPLTLVSGIGVLTWWDHRATIGTDWSDAEVVERLAAEHPAVAEHAAWTVMRREGPRTAAPALEKLLHSSDVDARRAAAVALTRIGPAALPALGTLELALEDPANAPIRTELAAALEQLRGYTWLMQQVELYRHQLLHDEDGQARNGAAFSLGQIGELAGVALPDLEKAARDPRNRDFADHMESVIERLRR